MKAIVCTKYGPPDVLQLKEVAKPSPKDNEVLIKIHATTVGAMDWKFRQGKNPIARVLAGLTKPKNPIFGIDVAGEVEAVGGNVTMFKQGDQVFAVTRNGAHAEYICRPEEYVCMKPTNMTYEEAAAVPFGGCVALQFLRDYGGIHDGQNVLVNGASGNVGTFAVQLAKCLGTEVTGVCSTTNVELVQSLGVDRVIDYRKEDFTKSGQTYDIIFDAVGKSSFSKCKSVLNKKGIYLSTVFTIPLLLQMLWTSRIGSKRAIFTMPPLPTTKDLSFLKDLIEAGKIKSVIDRTYPLSDIAEAHRYAEQGHAKGKVMITLEHNNKT